MAADSEPPDKPAEIVSGPPPSARPVQDRKRTFFHPLSGLAILGVDWLAFGIDLPTEFLFTPLVSLIAFGVTFWAVARIQSRDGDDLKRAYFKAFLGAVAAGVPLPVTGTIVGAAILLLSGLPTGSIRRR
ncbi:MAG: phosphoribosylaminoimidazole carboxylase [Elusimicrobia bacterium]|nr:phosphoribosylaminoimidazole carboxylase [Elusimicrobiota bacterium]